MTADFKKIILENTNTLISYYSSVVRDADNEIVKEIEEQLYFLTKRFPQGLKNLTKLKSLIEDNAEYAVFKVFVGVYYRDVESLSGDEAEKKRKKKIDEYIKDKDFIWWRKTILSIIKNYAQVENKGGFHCFYVSLNDLGKRKPEFARRLIAENEKELEPFLIDLITGLWASKQKEHAKRILADWTKEGKHLSTCASVFSGVGEIDESLLNGIYKKAQEKKDLNALRNIMRSVVNNFEKSRFGKDLFMNCLKELRGSAYYWWQDDVWYRGGPLLAALSLEDWDILLEDLLSAPDIEDHLLQEILAVLAQGAPQKLIAFFYERIERPKEEKQRYMYDPIPFGLDKLKEVLRQKPVIVIQEILKRF